MTLARPHKFLDAAELERWMESYYPEIMSEWELEGLCEFMDFWEFVNERYWDEMNEFEKWFRRNRQS